MRAAEAVRDGRASAMVSAGNTGATMASALLRMGRIKGVARPAIATPIPVPGPARPTVLLDAGANAECQPEWLVQFAQMGAVFARDRYGIADPAGRRCSRSARSPPRATRWSRRPTSCWPTASWIGATGATFVGNVEGRDLMTDDADVVVTDGFTGNVALKTLEGGLQGPGRRAARRRSTPTTSPRGRGRGAAAGAAAALRQLDPDNTGGAMLLGVDGVCIISHGSSSATAMVNAIAGGARDGRRPTWSATSAPPSVPELTVTVAGSAARSRGLEQSRNA